MSPRLIITVMFFAHVASMMGFAAFPALLPAMQSTWSLTNTEAGWISGIYFAGYVVAVAAIVPWTDRIDSRRIYLLSLLISTAGLAGFAFLADGFWSALIWNAIQGAGVGGTYMTGLKVLTDRLPQPVPSRGIAIYTAGFSVGAGVSFAMNGVIGSAFGWPYAFGIAALGPLLALIMVMVILRARPPLPEERPPTATFDFRPVLRNRAALAYMLGYAGHSWELFALRGWIVAFLVFASEKDAGTATAEASLIAALANLAAVGASLLGNELCERHGRRRVVRIAMVTSFVAALGMGLSPGLPFSVVVVLFFVYSGLIMGDSGSLTAGATQSADPGYRGVTLALHSLFGFTAGFLGPLTVGLVLDAAGDQTSDSAWLLAFATIGAGSLAGAVAMTVIGRRLGRAVKD
ncbi:MAG: MFS transporter [Alphaproteobacteria bacterium]|nr:MFS transporter [Alphaproteobacteria bacterium]